MTTHKTESLRFRQLFLQFATTGMLCMSAAGLSVPAAAAEEEEGRRPPPSTRQANTLTRAVYTRIENAQEFMEAEQYNEAEAELQEVRDLHERGRLNSYEQFVMYQFLGNIALNRDDTPGAINYFQQALQIPELGADQMGNLLSTIGQLQFREERFNDAIASFMQYLDTVENPKNDIYLYLAYAYYSIEDFQASIPWLLRNMEEMRADGEEIPKSTYDLLKSLYLTVEDYPKARDLLREVIVRFDAPEDWVYYAQIDGQMENLTNSAYTLYVANLRGFLEQESRLLTLASSMYTAEDPYGAAKLIEEGIDAGNIEGNADNLYYVAVYYQIAREYERAIPAIERAIAQEPSGRYYYLLGNLNYTLENYDEAIEAFSNAADAPDQDRTADVLMSLANTYALQNRYDEAIETAQRAGRADRDKADNAERAVSNYTQRKRRYEDIQARKQQYASFYR